MENDLKGSSEAKNNNAPQEHLSATVVEDFLDRNFDKLNLNHDRFLGKNEIAQALYQHKLSERDARIAEAVIPNMHKFELLSNDEWGTENNGISHKDITAFGTKGLRGIVWVNLPDLPSRLVA